MNAGVYAMNEKVSIATGARSRSATAVTPNESTTDDVVVRLHQVVRRFAAGIVLDHLNLSIQKGEFVVLLGRSGSGKTTLLRALAGLDRIDEGEIVVPSNCSVVFQEPRLMPWKSAWRNVALGLGVPHAESLAKAALAEVGLSHRTDAWPLTLSGGEAQRVALARALVRDPALLLLDEPFAALDALTRIKMHQLILSLWRKHAPAVLLVTHDVDEAILLADRILVLAEGRFVEEVRITSSRPRDAGQVWFRQIRRQLLQRLGVEIDTEQDTSVQDPSLIVVREQEGVAE